MPIAINNESEMLQFFCRHLVALCITYEDKDQKYNKTLKFAAFSGTLIKISNGIFFLTAGHILRHLEVALKSDKVNINTAVLADTFSLNRTSDVPIPFALKAAKFFYVDGEGLDFGVIPLDDYYVRLLATNGAVALSEENWIHQARLDFDGYAMLGLPDEFGSKEIDTYGSGIVSPTMFGVTRLKRPPSDYRPKKYEQFIGQLDRNLEIDSVVGMSGGPIFGFKLGGQAKYWIVALQSEWNRESRIVYGCSLPLLASLLVKQMADDIKN